MELHNLTNNDGARKKRKRIGRGPGSGHGKTSGKGHKGQKARSGNKRHFGFEGGQMPLHRRLPKRGFNHASRWPMAVVNVDSLDAHFEAGAEVSSESIVAAGLAKSTRGGIKVLGRGETSKKLLLKVQAVSPGARKKIEAAGGSVEIAGLSAPVPEAEQAQAE